MQLKDLVRVFVKGGVITPGEFLKVIHIAENMGSRYVRFGSRQDILFSVQDHQIESLEETFRSVNTQFEINTFHYQNISSSYVTVDLIPGKNWLVSYVYINILESFNYEPRLRINIADPLQGLVPLFTGHINFIASSQDNFWYVYLRLDKRKETRWQLPVMVYSDDIAIVSRAIEQFYTNDPDISYQAISRQLIEEVRVNYQPVTEELVFPDTIFPYYEGINRMSDGRYWLGLYWRENKYNTEILKAICERCLQTEVGKICLTPWKSFIVKGIQENDRIGWEKLMGKAGMNLRHSALEMNWHLPALDQEALELKIYLVRTLDQQDISTYGLTFTIKSNDDITLFTNIVIEKSNNTGHDPTYNILYSKDFNPNSGEYIRYATEVNREVIAPLLIELSQIYFDQLAEEVTDRPGLQYTDLISRPMYQCQHCLTVYDEQYGDPARGVAASTPFTNLPESYRCPVCGEGIKEYVRMS